MKPTREHATNNQQTYFVSSQTWQRRPLFRKECWAKLFIETLYQYRTSAYFLHEFVLMPEHFHLLITPKVSLERAVQFVKGGFSYKGKKELQSNLEVWQKGFTDHRIRDWEDCQKHVQYIYSNPVNRRLVSSPEEYPYSSIQVVFDRDPIPQRLKPVHLMDPHGTAEAVPLQSTASQGHEIPEGVPLQSASSPKTASQLQNPRSARGDSSRKVTGSAATPEGVPLQRSTSGGR